MASSNTRPFQKTPQPDEAKEKPRSHFMSATTIFSIIILIIIVVTFVGGPLVGNFASTTQLIFGYYGKEEIEYVPGNYMARQREIIADQISQSDADASIEYQAYQVWKGAYDRTVLHIAILADAEKSGVYVSSDRIDQTLVDFGPWTINGEFNEAAYNRTPNADRYSYRALYHEDIIHQTYVSDTLGTNIFSAKEAAFLKNIAASERKIRYVTFDIGSFPDSEVQRFAEQNSTLFRSISLSRITIKSGEKDAQTVRQQIESGASTFEEMATTQSKDAFADKGGEMGSMLYYSMESDFTSTADLDAVFALPKGSLSPVIETDFGWMIYRVDQEAADSDLQDPGVLGEVRGYMERFERGIIEDYMIGRGSDFKRTAETGDFLAASVSFGRLPYTTDFFPINYGNSFFLKQIRSPEGDTALSAAAYSQEFFTTVFSLGIDEVSEPLIIGNSVAVIQVTEERAAPEEETGFLEEYYPVILQQLQEEELSRVIFSSDDYVDNFNQVYAELFLSGN